MSLKNFKASLALAKELQLGITIGGGEPTLHKLCLDFVWMAARELMDFAEELGASVAIVTNGSREAQALELARMAKNGLIYARLSYDDYHDKSMVKDSVVRAFAKKKPGFYDHNDRDHRNTNPSEYRITPHGRAVENGMAWEGTADGCVCDGLFITPDGTIWQCGCQEVKLGHVSNLPAFLLIYPNLIGEDSEIPCSKAKS